MRCSIFSCAADRAGRAAGIGLLVLLAIATPVQAARVDLYAPRAFGYFLGDRLILEAVITLDRGYRLDASSLPQPRSVTYWLDLRQVSLKELPEADGARRYLLRLTYQTFYAPLSPRALDIPALPLVAEDGAARLDLSVPAWTFVASPLREITSTRASDPMALRPDILPMPYTLRDDLIRAGAALGLALASLLMLAIRRGWGPFARRHRPFAGAARQMGRILGGRPEADAYKAALLTLHRAFDAAAGRRLLADDVPRFLTDRPALAGAEDAVARLFAASRIAFFGTGPRQAMEELPPEALMATARRLAAAERTAGPLRPRDAVSRAAGAAP